MSNPLWSVEDVVDAVRRYQRTHNGSPPTIREIALEAGISSPATVKKLLDRALIEGMVQKAPGGLAVARAWSVVDRGCPVCERLIPLLSLVEELWVEPASPMSPGEQAIHYRSLEAAMGRVRETLHQVPGPNSVMEAHREPAV